MKLLDTNLWLALSLSKHTHHSAARAWLEGEDEPDSLAFCRSTQQSLHTTTTLTNVTRMTFPRKPTV